MFFANIASQLKVFYPIQALFDIGAVFNPVQFLWALDVRPSLRFRQNIRITKDDSISAEPDPVLH